MKYRFTDDMLHFGHKENLERMVIKSKKDKVNYKLMGYDSLQQLKIYKIAKDNNIPEWKIELIWLATYNNQPTPVEDFTIDYNAKVNMTTMPKETRDNKGVYIGGGGSNRNKIRYPKKNRSVATWRKFYAMFPWAAEEDNWDGKKSSRYPN